MTATYYNENDPSAAAWLRALIAEGHLAPGYVDDRSIEDVRPNDLDGFTQCHFFAGIGGWPLALRLAGWPDDRPVWTGSCPCQPFSSAGARAGFDDERHLWPAWFHLIAQRLPGVVFGEQVASRAALQWFDLVRDDLESAAYAVGAVDLCAAGVGAPHIRQRLYWVADRHAAGCGEQRATQVFDHERPSQWDDANGRGAAGALGDAERTGLEIPLSLAGIPPRTPWGVTGQVVERTNPLDAWASLEWLDCSDGKARPTQPGLFPLADGLPNRVGRLRAYGNAIVPQVAAHFIASYLRTS